MIALDVYKFLNRTIAERPSVFTEEDAAQSRNFVLFQDKNSRIIVVFDQHICRSILVGSSFIQPGIADAVDRILKVEDDKPNTLVNTFLRKNPIQADGETHACKRKRYLAAFSEAEKAASPMLPDIARGVLEAAANRNDGVTADDLVAPYVDRALAIIVERCLGQSLDPELWSGSAGCIMEFFHSRSKLLKKEEQVRDLIDKLGGSGRHDMLDLALSYVLQGRDPLLGTLTAFSLYLASLSPSKRAVCLEKCDVRQLFATTSPVNYIGRTATKSVKIGNLDVHEGDQIILMLPWAANQGTPGSAVGLAFGAGKHICAGQALGLRMATAWLSILQEMHGRISWDRMPKPAVSPSVFLQWEASNGYK
ncbi:hypothetical protein [Rhizobium sp. PAMB 3182]